MCFKEILIRRCGKSVILKQIMNELKEQGVNKEHIIYVNFEFIEYEELQDYKELNKYIKEKIVDEKKYYVFLDEIQKVDKFEEVVNSLRASIENISIFITGSNSKLGLKDTVLFDLLLQYIVDITGREFSAENAIKFLKNEGKSVSTETLYIYLDALCKALMMKKNYNAYKKCNKNVI